MCNGHLGNFSREKPNLKFSLEEDRTRFFIIVIDIFYFGAISREKWGKIKKHNREPYAFSSLCTPMTAHSCRLLNPHHVYVRCVPTQFWKKNIHGLLGRPIWTRPNNSKEEKERVSGSSKKGGAFFLRISLHPQHCCCEQNASNGSLESNVLGEEQIMSLLFF